MKAVVVKAAAVGFAVVVTLGVGALSQLPYDAESGDHAVVRLAWRVRGIRVDDCRPLSPEELERLPSHMRITETCEGRMLPYRLRLFLDERPVVDQLIRASGARGDRPLYVYHEEHVAPGVLSVRVEFELQTEMGDARSGDGAVPGRQLESLEREHLTPMALELVAEVSLAAGEVALVTYDAEGRRLVLRGYGSQ